MPSHRPEPAAAAAAVDAELGSSADAVIDTATASQQEALQTLEKASAAVLAGVSRVQREVADFVSERIRKEMEAQAALMRCRTLGEVGTVQTAFIRAAMDQYSTEANRLMQIGGELVAKSLDRRAD